MKYIIRNGKTYVKLNTLTNVKKGDQIVKIEKDYYDGKESELTLRVDRIGKVNVSVTCVEGYMRHSSWKINKEASSYLMAI